MTDAARAADAVPPAGERDAARSPSALVDAAWIFAGGLVVALVLRPFQDAPFVDDWVYAWSVRELLAGRGLVILDWSSHPNFAQILWGALFAWPTGFSFVALRVSTWVAALLALCTLQTLLRELGVARRDAFLGTATMAANPVFLVLAATFMTDVSFVAALLGASLCFVVALRRRSDGWLAAYVSLACVASAIRVVAVVAPAAALLTLALHGGAWGRRPRRLAVAALPLLFFALLVAWGEGRFVHVADLSDIVGSPVFRRRYLIEALVRHPELAPQALLCVAGSAGLVLLPLAAAVVPGRVVRRRTLPVLAVLAVAAGAAWGLGIGWPPPLAPGFTWTWSELGATEPLVTPAPEAFAPAWASAALTVVCFVSFALVVAMLLRRLRPEEAFLAWSAAGHLGLVAILWLLYDRYMLPLVPFLIALALAGRPRLRRPVAVALLASFALIGAVGLRDHLAYSEALWEAVARLRARGVAESDIDAGYVVNGWLHYAAPARPPRGADGRAVFPWITDAGGTLRYQVTNRPLGGWTVLDSVAYRRWLGRSGAIYLLERDPR